MPSMYEKFEGDAIAALKHYVYALFDPVEPTMPFYIGEGQGNRVFAHAEGNYFGIDKKSRKQAVIEAIRTRPYGSNRVVHKVLVWGLPTQSDSQIVESALIQLIQHMHPERLTNLNKGMSKPMMDTRDLAAELNAPELLNTGDAVGLIVKIRRRWAGWIDEGRSAADISREELFEAARGDWKRSLNRVQPHKVVLVVGGSIVREVFFADGWIPAKDVGRVCMNTASRPDDARAEDYRNRFIGRSVKTMLAHATRPEVMYLPLNPQVEVLEEQVGG